MNFIDRSFVPAACADPNAGPRLKEASILATGAQVSFDTTKIDFAVGANDCSAQSSVVPGVLAFATALKSHNAEPPVKIIAGTPHHIPSSDTGMNELRLLIEAGCK